MNYFEIVSLPEILFAHGYRAESYCKQFNISKRTIEITYILEGSFIYTVGSKRYPVKKGDVLCGFRVEQGSVAAPQYHRHHTVAAKMDWRVSDGMQGLLLPMITPAEYHTAEICRLIDEFVYNEILYKTNAVKGAAKFLELLCAIDQCNRKSRAADLPSERLYAERAKAYIQKNIHAPITQNSVAEHLGVSPEYLCAVFKKAEGSTMMRYINRLKLQSIKALMDHADLHLYEAAAMYGYSDPNYVSRLYKQLFGHNISDKPHLHPEYK